AMAIYNTISGKGCALVAEKDNDHSKVDLAHQTLDHTQLSTYSKVHTDEHAHQKEDKDEFHQEELKNTYDHRDEKSKEHDGKTN
ncbi:hypothetical protein CHS0354_034131, partial [Potamilus streckersoni]